MPRLIRTAALKRRHVASHAGAKPHPHAHARAEAHAAAQARPGQHAIAGPHAHAAHAHAEAAAHHAHVIPGHVVLVAAALPHHAHAAEVAKLLHSACQCIQTDVGAWDDSRADTQCNN